jgi:hypothetical protein
MQTTGPRSWYYYGSTFSLETGALLPVETIVETDSVDFRNLIVDFLAAEPETDMTVEELKKFYGTEGTSGYEADFHGEKLALNYEYFYDGEWVYIILNYGVFHNAGAILKWNGRYGEAVSASLIGYVVEADKTLRLLEYS